MRSSKLRKDTRPFDVSDTFKGKFILFGPFCEKYVELSITTYFAEKAYPLGSCAIRPSLYEISNFKKLKNAIRHSGDSNSN